MVNTEKLEHIRKYLSIKFHNHSQFYSSLPYVQELKSMFSENKDAIFRSEFYQITMKFLKYFDQQKTMG